VAERPDLSRRERQIMDIVYRRDRVTVSEVLSEIPDPPSYSAVRALMRKLEEKGHLKHQEEGPRYVYSATLPRDKAKNSALNRLVRTFFEGSPVSAVAALLDSSSGDLSEEDLERLDRMIRQAREKGGSK